MGVKKGEEESFDEFMSRMRLLEEDHEPDGWPAVQMKEISALCDLVENAVPSIDLLQTRLESGDYLAMNSDGEWWLFSKSGERICGGGELRKVFINLIFLDC